MPAVAWLASSAVSAAVFHLTVAAAPVAPERVTVKVMAPPSAALASAMAKLGSASSSVIEITSLVTVTREVPVTSMVSEPSWRVSWVGSRSKVPVALAAPAEITMLKFATAA